MGLVTGGSGGGGTWPSPLIDFHEDINGYDQPPSGTNTNYVSRSGVPLRVAPANGFNLVWNIVRVNAGNILRVMEVVSSGAGRGTQVLTNYNFPFGRLIGAAGTPQYPRPLQQYLWTRPMRATVRGAARIEMGITATNGGLSLLGNDPGAVWTSDPAVNGGAWTPQFRLVAAGAITNGTNSGVFPDAVTFRTIGIRLSERPVSAGGNLVEWLIDDTVRFAAAVDINSATVSTFFPISGVGQTAGTTLQFGEQRFQVIELG